MVDFTQHNRTIDSLGQAIVFFAVTVLWLLREKMVERCTICPRYCENRNFAGSGFCGAGDVPRCYRHRIEYGEEIFLSPSHLFYLSGCNLRCRFCIGEERAMTPSLGEPLTSHFFQDALEWGRRQGARNIQWVGGEPSIHLNSILTLMRNTPNLPPVIWKSNLYLNSHAIDQLWEFVNVFVADFKFGNKYCATTLCGADNYFEWVTAALLAIYRRKPEALVVRHLLMPGHFNCCFLPVLDWFTQKIPQAVFSLRDGYIPAWQAKNDPVLGVRIDPNDVRRAEKIVYERCLHVT